MNRGFEEVKILLKGSAVGMIDDTGFVQYKDRNKKEMLALKNDYRKYPTRNLILFV